MPQLYLLRKAYSYNKIVFISGRLLSKISINIRYAAKREVWMQDHYRTIVPGFL
jgi:hypothetical protein